MARLLLNDSASVRLLFPMAEGFERNRDVAPNALELLFTIFWIVAQNAFNVRARQYP